MKRSVFAASAPGKVTLFGEHFVVYGNTAILAAIDRRTVASTRIADETRIASDIGAAVEYGPKGARPIRGGGKAVAALAPIHASVKKILDAHGKNVGVDLSLTSNIPDGIGLGSSAASCVAAVASVDSLFSAHDKYWVCERAIESERMVHKNASGADCYVSAFGGIIRYSKEGGYSKVKAGKPLRMVVSSTGIRHSTGDLVEKVRRFRESNKALFSDLSSQAGEISLKAMGAIESGKIREIGHLMLENQRLLKAIGVSHPKSEEIIDLCLNSGALGAKVTGAGGGGAVICLASSTDESKRISSRLIKKGHESMEVQVDYRGLVVRRSSGEGTVKRSQTEQ